MSSSIVRSSYSWFLAEIGDKRGVIRGLEEMASVFAPYDRGRLGGLRYLEGDGITGVAAIHASREIHAVLARFPI